MRIPTKVHVLVFEMRSFKFQITQCIKHHNVENIGQKNIGGYEMMKKNIWIRVNGLIDDIQTYWIYKWLMWFVSELSLK